MLRSWRLGKLFAIPIYVNPTFLLVPVLVLLQTPGGPLTLLFALALALSVFGCVLLHELGHALMARYFGIGTLDITLYPIGGVARLTRMSEDPKEELLIALAGPAVNVVIAILLTPFLLLLGGAAVLEGALPAANHSLLLGLVLPYLFYLWASNIALVVFNLLPAFPMDGGRVFRAVLSMMVGHYRATEIAAKVGLVMAVLLGLLALWSGNFMLILVAGFVAFAGQQELFMVRHRARAQMPHSLDEPPSESFDAEPAAPLRTFEPTYRPSQPDFSGYTWDQHYQVWVKWHNGQPIDAFWGEVR